MKAGFLLGRLLFGGFFLYNGINHFREHENMAQYAGAKNVPMPDLAVKASGAMLIVGGASLILGLKPKFGAAAILSFLAGVSPLMHDFWNQEDAGQRQSEMAQFSKNVALAAAALALGNASSAKSSEDVEEESLSQGKAQRFNHQRAAA